MIDQKELKKLFIYDNEKGNLIWNVSLSPRGKIGSVAGHAPNNSDGRIVIRIYGKLYLAHRLVWAYINGEVPEFIDHIDGNRGNNKIENLRSATIAENGWNSKKRSTNKSGQKGVCFDKNRNKWVAHLTVNGVSVLQKRFVNFTDAVAEYSLTARKFHGEFLRESEVK